MNLYTYIKYSTVIAIFTEAMKIQTFIDIKPFYFIIILNVILLMALKKPFKAHSFNLVAIVFLTLHGLLGLLLVKFAPSLLISQIVGTTILSISFYYIVRTIGFRELYVVYAKLAFWVCVIAIIMFFLGITLKEEERLHGIFNEPSSYVIAILPSVYYYFKMKHWWKFSILLFSMILAGSSLGFIGLLLFIILPNLKIKYIKRAVIIIPLLVVIGYFLSKDEEFSHRFTSTFESLEVFDTKKFAYDTNLSTYALLSNAFVTWNNFIDYPFGTGFGSHEARYETYAEALETPRYIIIMGHEKLNFRDANSMFLRLVTDLGIFGIMLSLYFIFLVYKAFQSSSYEGIIAQSLAVYFLLKLLRQGHYFPEEFYLFLFIFLFAVAETRREPNRAIDE